MGDMWGLLELDVCLSITNRVHLINLEHSSSSRSVWWSPSNFEHFQCFI